MWFPLCVKLIVGCEG